MAAAATVAGQSLGAGLKERAMEVPKEAVKVGLYIATPLALLFLFAPRLLLGVFGMTDPLVLELGEQFLAYLSLSAFFLMAALAYTGALQGTGDTRSPMYISIFSQLILPLGICALLDMSHGLRPADIWLAIVIGHFTRCALSMLRFHQGKWRHIEVSIGNA
jgi:Na+-driven multidrug efflux pump